MKTNLFIKLLVSIPVILIVLYFIPVLGVFLLIFRYIIYSNKKRIYTPITILIVGLLILIPKLISMIFNATNISINVIPYLNNILTSDLYNINFIKYSKLLISIGVIFLILSFIFRNLFNKASAKINDKISKYITETEKRDIEISRSNDMKMKEKREKAKNTNYVKCPYCGSDNLLSEKTGKCKFCRRTILNNNYHE